MYFWTAQLLSSLLPWTACRQWVSLPRWVMRLKNLYRNNLPACDWMLQYCITVPSRVGRPTRRPASPTTRVQRRDGRRSEWAKLLLLRCTSPDARQCFADLVFFCMSQLRTSPKVRVLQVMPACPRYPREVAALSVIRSFLSLLIYIRKIVCNEVP